MPLLFSPEMDQDMEYVPPEMVKSRRSMSIHSICDPLASSISTLSDHDSDATLNVNDRMSLDGELPKYDALSASEEQAVRALEDLRAGISNLQKGTNFRYNTVSPAESARFPKSSTELFNCEYSGESMGSGKKL